MKWEHHKSLTLAACKMLGIDCVRLKEAVLLPDREPEYRTVYGYTGRKLKARRIRIGHHSTAAVDAAFRHMKVARRKLIRGGDFIPELGKALHYLQDYAIDPRRKILIFSIRSEKAHEERENLEIFPDREAMKKALETKIYPHEFIKIAKRVGRKRTVEEISTAASYLTALALKLVVKPEKPEDLDSKIQKGAVNPSVPGSDPLDTSSHKSSLFCSFDSFISRDPPGEFSFPQLEAESELVPLVPSKLPSFVTGFRLNESL